MTTPTARTKRECICERVRHVHGTEAAYSKDGCRCLACSVARSTYVAGLARGVVTEARCVSILGTRRRLQALAVLGYSAPEIARHAGLNSEVVLRLRSGRSSKLRYSDDATVQLATRDVIAAVYDALWNVPSAGPKATRLRNEAAAAGWVPPAAWDDDEIDLPDAKPHTARGSSAWELAPCGTEAAARRHYRHGEPLDEACKQASRRRWVARKPAA